MKKTGLVYVAFFGIALSALGVAIFSFTTTPKIGFVRTPELVYGYLGTREARRNFEEEKASMLANLDTLRKLQADLLDEFQTAEAASVEYENLKDKVIRSSSNVKQYEQFIQEQANQEDEKLMSGVLNQINDFAAEYGDMHGYDFILGTTNSGSLLYAREADDLTVEMLDELNRTYSGKE